MMHERDFMYGYKAMQKDGILQKTFSKLKERIEEKVA